MKRKDGNKNTFDDLENVRFSDLRTTGMILKEIENELIPRNVSNTDKLSSKVLLGEWVPWYTANDSKIELKKPKLSSINFLIQRTIGKKRNTERVII